MSFLAPLWLTLIVPWAVLVAWLWRRRTEEASTTAAFLWRQELSDVSRERTTRRRPAAWIITALIALLLLIAALANPARPALATRLNVLVDGSASLAAVANGTSLRAMSIESIEADLATLRAEGVRVETFVRVIGSGDRTDSAFSSAKTARFTAKPTAAMLNAAVNDVLSRGEAVVVLTDANVARDDPRLIVRAPSSPRENVGIVFAIAYEHPKPSLMVRIENDSSRKSTRLSVTAAGWWTERDVTLSPRGQTTDVFIDLPAMPGETIEASLIGEPDDFATDDHAAMLRTHGGVTLTLADSLPPIAGRFAAAFERSHASAAEPRMRITLRDADGLPARSSEPTILLPHAWPILAAGTLSLVDHPVLRDIDLASPSIERVAVLPPGDWTILSRRGDVPLLAVREAPSRSVWIGFELDTEQLRSVVLLSNAVEWLADASPVRWSARKPEDVAVGWRATFVREPSIDAAPGLYADEAGRAVAIQMPADAGPHGVSRGDLLKLLRREERLGRHSMRPSFALAASAFAALAVVLLQFHPRGWRRRPSRS